MLDIRGQMLRISALNSRSVALLRSSWQLARLANNRPIDADKPAPPTVGGSCSTSEHKVGPMVRCALKAGPDAPEQLSKIDDGIRKNRSDFARGNFETALLSIWQL